MSILCIAVMNINTAYIQRHNEERTDVTHEECGNIDRDTWWVSGIANTYVQGVSSPIKTSKKITFFLYKF